MEEKKKKAGLHDSLDIRFDYVNFKAKGPTTKHHILPYFTSGSEQSYSTSAFYCCPPKRNILLLELNPPSSIKAVTVN